MKKDHESGIDSRVVIRELTEAIDTLVLKLLLEHLSRILHTDELPPHILLLAQGGYGRRHQHPQSDLDILFLYSDTLHENEQQLIAEYFRTLFDLGFKVGNCCRSIKQAFDSAQTDPHSQTAMSESRFLAGDWRLFEQFKKDLWKALQKNRKDRIQTKIHERNLRLSRHGSTINISEPNVKESPGGLRDFHFGLWIGSLILGRTLNLLHLKRSHLIDDQTMAGVDDAVAFLWRLRNDLHFLTGKEQDVLAMPLQQEIAQRLGYTDKGNRLAEEIMMRDYYRHALTILQFANQMIKKASSKSFWAFLRFTPHKVLRDGFTVCDNEIYIPQDIHFFEHNPRRIIKAFILAAQQNARLSDITATAIHDNLDLVDQAFLHDKHTAEFLRTFLSLDCNIEPQIKKMRNVGLLELLFPEWRGISSLVRYDLVHRYTVDEHSLICLYHLEHPLEDTVQYSEERFVLWRECQEKDLLRLAVLFHDIGKGREGDHSVIGAQLVDEIAQRLRFSATKRKRLIFFVRHHLLMSHTAQHFDLNDPTVPADFSDTFDRIEDLDIMYLMTYVDMRSVSPEAMTEWKNNLLWQLYLASREIFLSESSVPKDHHVQVVSRKEKVISHLSSHYETSVIEDHLNHLPPSYLLNQSTQNIRHHLEMVQAFDGEHPQIRLVDHVDPGCKNLVLVYKDKVGLFNRICAAVTLENFDIMEARLNTRSDGVVANTISLRDSLNSQPVPPERLTLLQERIERILVAEGEIPRPPKPLKASAVGRSSFEDTVKISNDQSARYTVIVIRCADRHGLLYDLTANLSNLEINIHFARIITEGSRVTDIFYVADAHGEKICEQDRIDKIKRSLLESLERSS